MKNRFICAEEVAQELSVSKPYAYKLIRQLNDELKAKVDELFKDLGTDTTTAIRMFLTQALSVNGFPFEIKRARTNPYEALSEAEFLEKLEKSRQNAAEGKYRDASEVSRNMRGKYGL